jgi:mannose-6-phosphate isomerase-like protein (cupin superfamily)
VESRDAVVNTRTVADLEKEIDSLIADGYRLDMIMPADAPRKALLSRGTEEIRLSQNPRSAIRNPKSARGRAGMEYRDLIPDRLGGRLIASHIRIVDGGPVPDYVHYHKIDFQIIYCKAGWIRVVYEDQGEPFLLESGDCVLQPPEIRHRVLESSAGAEVIELSSPAEHETWVEHELELPTDVLAPDRSFGGQTFVRHIAKDASWENVGNGFEARDLGVFSGSRGSVVGNVLRTAGGGSLELQSNGPGFLFVLDGSATVAGVQLNSDDSFLIPANESAMIDASPGTTLLHIDMRDV